MLKDDGGSQGRVSEETAELETCCTAAEPEDQEATPESKPCRNNISKVAMDMATSRTDNQRAVSSRSHCSCCQPQKQAPVSSTAAGGGSAAGTAATAGSP